MSILQCFVRAKVLPTVEDTQTGEKPTAEANKCMAEVLERQQSGLKLKPTVHSDTAHAKIGKYAAIHATASARRHFKTQLGDLPESTVHKYKQLYQKEVFACAKYKDVHDILSLPPKKLRQPHTLEESRDTDIHALQLAGTPASCGLVLAAAKGIGMSKERTLLYDNRGHVALTRMGIFSLEVNVLCHTERVK